MKKYDTTKFYIKSRDVYFGDIWEEFYMFNKFYLDKNYVIKKTKLFRRQDISDDLKDIKNLTIYLGHNCNETFSVLVL